MLGILFIAAAPLMLATAAVAGLQSGRAAAALARTNLDADGVQRWLARVVVVAVALAVVGAFVTLTVTLPALYRAAAPLLRQSWATARAILQDVTPW
jgi:hypothetical protein